MLSESSQLSIIFLSVSQVQAATIVSTFPSLVSLARIALAWCIRLPVHTIRVLTTIHNLPPFIRQVRAAMIMPTFLSLAHPGTVVLAQCVHLPFLMWSESSQPPCLTLS